MSKYIAFAQRNALNYPIRKAEETSRAPHRIGESRALHHAFNFKMQHTKDICGAFRAVLVIDASGKFPEWNVSILYGESKEPLSAAAPLRIWKRDTFRKAEKLVMLFMTGIGIPASEAFDNGREGPGWNPVALSCRKSCTLDEVKQIRKALKRNGGWIQRTLRSLQNRIPYVQKT